MKKILIATTNNINSNPRPNRMLSYFISKNYDVSVLSYHNTNGYNNKFVKLEKNKTYSLDKIFSSLKIFCLLDIFLKNKYKSNINNNYDIIFCCNIELLPYLFKIKQNAKIIIDLREHFPSQFNNIKWKIFNKNIHIFTLKNYVKKSDKIITVGKLISDEYKKEFGFDSEVVMSLPEKGNYTSELKKEYNKIKVVHHGVGLRKRKIENMINLMSYLDDRFELDIYLVNKNEKYYNYLLDLAKTKNNVKILKPVDYKNINIMLSKYDIGLFYLENTNVNLKYALPNKLFEYIQAGLCLTFSPNDEMKNIIDKYNVGFVSSNYDIKELAFKINNLSNDELNKYKVNSQHAAKTLNIDENNKYFDRIINKLLFENA